LSSVRSKEARRQQLFRWYQQAARDLPWRRHTSDPYRIWISEIMLQQTQVATVLPRFSGWMQHFPDIESLAAASPDAVIKAWEGLGYYRRARFIHSAARQIVTEHGGHFPADFDTILGLPGIGRSTAGAIASFCFGATTPVLDGNVKRVLKRWHGGAPVPDASLWKIAQQAIETSTDPAMWNQAMMELGATVCISRNPACAACPVSRCCRAAFHAPRPTRRPVRARDAYWRVHLYLDNRRNIWLAKRPDSGIWGGLWTPPISELDTAPNRAPCHVHQLTHRRLHLYGKVMDGAPPGDGQWVADITQFALPTGIHQLLEKCGLGL